MSTNSEYVRDSNGIVKGVKVIAYDASGRPYYTTIATGSDPNATQVQIDAVSPALIQAAVSPAVAPGFISMPNSVVFPGA